jgi:xanthine dehydrogenase iron-sulfur cluster and FAD-binding subunit A
MSGGQPEQPANCVLHLGLPRTATKTLQWHLFARQAIQSCQVPVETVADGREIVTIEGLGRAGVLSPLQRAFFQHTASGCTGCHSAVEVMKPCRVGPRPDAAWS